MAIIAYILQRQVHRNLDTRINTHLMLTTLFKQKSVSNILMTQ